MDRLSDFPSALTRCFSFDGPDEGVAMDEERKEPRPANDNGYRSGQSLDPRIPRIAAARTLRHHRAALSLPKRAARCAVQGDDVRLWDAS